MARKVRFGLTLSNRGVLLGLTQPSELLKMAEAAESAGVFEHVWVGDSIMAKPRLEAMTLMGAIAARTSKVRIGPACMATFPSRNPIVMAHQWASLDLISEGRMIMAACMGGSLDQQDHRIEYRNMGMKALDRSRRMEESIEILRRLWTEDSVDYDGEFHHLEGAFIEPKPVQQPPPIWIVSNPRLRTGKPHIIERALKRVARMSDGWMTTFTSEEEFGIIRERICSYAGEFGRSFDDLPCVLYFNINVNEDREAAFNESKKYLDLYYTTDYTPAQIENWVALGSPQQCIDRIQGFVDLGATDITLRLPSWDQEGQFKRVVNEVLPHFL